MPRTEHLYALSPGTRLKTYTIERVLGTGGFGITYRAAEDITGRAVAIKEYLPAGLAMRGSDHIGVRPARPGAQQDFHWGLDRFRDEAKRLIALRHPGIVPMLAYFEANGTGYLVMEYQEGESLGTLLSGGQTLGEAQLRALLLPLLEGIGEVHRRGFLHRDIKPDNIFVRSDGFPILLDFGAARQALGARTHSLTSIVTDGYAPIEQYESAGDQGPWTDMYALGAVMFRALLGYKPPDAPRRLAARMKNEPDPIAESLARIATQCSQALTAAVTAALGITESERPQTIAALRAILETAPSRPRPAAATRHQISAPSPADTLLPLLYRAGHARRLLVWLVPGVAALAALALAAWLLFSPAPAFIETSGFGAVSVPELEQRSTPLPDARPAVATRAQLTRRMYELIMAAPLEAIATYRNSGAHKALFACIDWSASSPSSAAVRAVGYGYNYQDPGQAIERAAAECRKWSPGSCSCTLTDANLVLRLVLPDTFAAQHSQ